MIFFSSDPEFEVFYQEFSTQNLRITALVTESPKKQGRDQKVKPNPAHLFAQSVGLPVFAFEKLDESAVNQITKSIDSDPLGFIFAYGKIIPKNIIDLFENGILNIHFSLLPEYPGASPIQQALLDDKKETGYTIFEITDKLDQGKLLTQEKVEVLPDDNFDSLRYRIISNATRELPNLIKKYLKWEITLQEMPTTQTKFTRRISKEDGLISEKDDAHSAYNKIRAFSRWPKTYLMIDGKRLIIHEAKISGEKLEILEIQPEGRKIMSGKEFRNGYQTLLTKLPLFVKIS